MQTNSCISVDVKNQLFSNAWQHHLLADNRSEKTRFQFNKFSYPAPTRSPRYDLTTCLAEENHISVSRNTKGKIRIFPPFYFNPSTLQKITHCLCDDIKVGKIHTWEFECGKSRTVFWYIFLHSLDVMSFSAFPRDFPRLSVPLCSRVWWARTYFASWWNCFFMCSHFKWLESRLPHPPSHSNGADNEKKNFSSPHIFFHSSNKMSTFFIRNIHFQLKSRKCITLLSSLRPWKVIRRTFFSADDARRRVHFDLTRLPPSTLNHPCASFSRVL